MGFSHAPKAVNHIPSTLNATDRGYGLAHKKQRERLKYNHIDGTPCDICGEPMYRNKEQNPDGATLEADHRQGDKTQLADRLLHRRCNRQIANNWQEHGEGWHQKHNTPPTTKPQPAQRPEGRTITW